MYDTLSLTLFFLFNFNDSNIISLLFSLKDIRFIMTMVCEVNGILTFLKHMIRNFSYKNGPIRFNINGRINWLVHRVKMDRHSLFRSNN